MGFYDNYRARVQSTLTDSEYINEDNKNLVIDNFENQPNYYIITKNFDLATTYKVLIAEENKKDNIIGYKKLISYPYVTTQFTIGDYINWDSNVWLLSTLDDQYDYSVGGRIVKTNADLKWRDDNGVLISYPCFKTNRATDTGFWFGKGVVLPEGNITAQVQINSDTNTIFIGKRFIIDGMAYKVHFMHPIEGLLELYFETDAISEYDDLINDIADNTIRVFTLEINQDDFNQIIGYSSTLSATVKCNGEVINETVTWSSSDTAKVSITSAGIITCIAEGSTTITCQMTDNTSISDTITITVVAATTPVEEIRISPAITFLYQGDMVTYTVYMYKNDVVQADTFTITTSGAAISKYDCQVINGNSFSVENLEQSDTDLVVRCTNNVDATYKEIEIILGGIW